MMIVFVLSLVLYESVSGSSETDKELDRLLKIDDIYLPPKLLKFRRAIFEANWVLKEEGEELNLEAMYTLTELERQKGARMAPDFQVDEELQKREEMGLANQADSTPESWDNRNQKMGNGEPLLNKVANQETCGNCYLHTFLGALEIQYAKATGKKIKFSEQELTDCYFKGCHGGDVRMVAKWMSYIDKLSSKDDYGDYLSDTFTCRENTTPDSLREIKIVDALTVTTDNIEAAVFYYGSVMTCMKWGSAAGEACRMDNYKKTTGIVDYPEFKEGCDHAVLIVGYTPDFYIVRNSHGATWGDGGYFYIKRGINSCGIEEIMAAIIVESRSEPKNEAPNGCPIDKPIFCKASNTCTDKECLTKERTKREERVRLPGEREKRDIHIQNGSCADFHRRCPVLKIGCDRITSIRRICPMSCNTCGSTKSEEKKRSAESDSLAVDSKIHIQKRSCADTHPQCPMLKIRLTCAHPATTMYCPKLCNKCGAEEEIIPPKKSEKKGSCYRPTIANSLVSVMNTPIMSAGQRLNVECVEPYTLVGKPVKCLIQDVFTNEYKDARLMPECIKLGSDTLVGNGATYTGSKNTYIDPIGREIECDNWNKDIFEGYLMNDLEAKKYALGNHNYCRNPGGHAPVPMCLSQVNEVTTEVYCFQHPGCNTCAGATNKPGYSTSYCKSGMKKGRCKYVDVTTLQSQLFYWDKCQKTCCEVFC